MRPVKHNGGFTLFLLICLIKLRIEWVGVVIVGLPTGTLWYESKQWVGWEGRGRKGLNPGLYYFYYIKPRALLRCLARGVCLITTGVLLAFNTGAATLDTHQWRSGWGGEAEGCRLIIDAFLPINSGLWSTIFSYASSSTLYPCE